MVIYEWEIKLRQEELIRSIEREHMLGGDGHGGLFHWVRDMFVGTKAVDSGLQETPSDLHAQSDSRQKAS
jgi:hypothetical protein